MFIKQQKYENLGQIYNHFVVFYFILEISFFTSSLKIRANLKIDEIGPLAFSPCAASLITFSEVFAALEIASAPISLAWTSTKKKESEKTQK